MKAIVYLSGPFDVMRYRAFAVTVPPGATPGNCWQKEPRHYSRRYVHGTLPQWGVHERINKRAEWLTYTAPTGRREDTFPITPHRISKAVARHHRRRRETA